MRVMRFVGICITAAVVGCTSPTSVCGCPPIRPPSGIVYGTVTRAAVPVVGAEVSVAMFTDCGNARLPVTYGRGYEYVATTGPGGWYDYEAMALAPMDTTCVRVVARLGSDSVVSEGVRLTLRDGGAVRDRVRVDLALP
jgi:hypothetical protein